MPFKDDAEDYFYTATGEDGVLKGYNSNSLKFSGLEPGDPFEGKLRMPYIKSPVFAFKYYEYGIDTLTPRRYLTESSSCMFDFNEKLKRDLQDNFAEFCRSESGCSGKSYKDWDNLAKLSYYNDIRYAVELGFSPTDSAVAEAQTPPTNEELNSALQAVVNLCNVNCEDKRTKIRTEVLREFSDNCFELEGCAKGDYTVTNAEIEIIVDQLIAECKNECHIMDSTTKATECPDGALSHSMNEAGNMVYPCYQEVDVCYELNISPQEPEPYYFHPLTGIQKYMVTPECIENQFELMRGAQIVLDLNLSVENPNCNQQTPPEWIDNQAEICPSDGQTSEYTEMKTIEAGLE